MQDYSGYSDEELIVRIRDGESEISDYIINEYKELVRKKAGSLFILGADREDLIQEGMIGLFKAIRDYDTGRDASFRTFADICVSRQMFTAIQSASRQKHMPLNQYISLCGDDEKEDNYLANAFCAATDIDPESITINKELLTEIGDACENCLSNLERQIFELHMAGMGYAEIARVLGRDAKSTDNALQRSKTKIRKALGI